MGKYMLTKSTGPLLNTDAVNTDGSSTTPNLFDPSQEFMPVNKDHPLTMSDNEIQLAGLGGLSSQLSKEVAPYVANILGRSFKWFGDNELGTSYTKLQKLEEAKKAKEAAKEFKDSPEKSAIDALRAVTPNEIDVRARGFKPPESAVAPPSRQVGVDTAGTQSRTLFDEMENTDGYKRWITLGDADLDLMMKGSLGKPEIKDGMIAGIRIKGTTPGMEVKVPDENHMYGIINSTGSVIASKLAGQSESSLKQISQDQTKELAILLGMDEKKLLSTLAGGRFELGNAAPGKLAATVVASKNLLINEIRTLDRLADKAALSGSDADRWAWKRQAELVANIQASYKGVQSDIARAMNAMKIPVGTDEFAITRDYSKMLDEFGGSDNIAAQIDIYRNLPDLPQRLHSTRHLSKARMAIDALHDIWINSMLSGWFTHLKNTVGVVGAMVADVAETTGAATGQLVTRSARGMERDVTYGDVAAKIFGQMMSMKEAFTAGGRAFWTREDALSGSGAEMSLITGNRFRADGFSSEAFGATGNWAKAADWSGHVLTLGRAPTRMLMLEDSTMKVISYRGSLYEQAYRQAREQGLKGDDFSTSIAEFLFDPPRQAVDKATEQAKYVTLQSDTEGWAKHLQKAANQNRFFRFLMPFYKTPVNALLWVGERSPLAPLGFINRYKKAIDAGGAEAAQARTRWAMGSTIMAMLAFNYEANDIYGGISPDPKVRDAYRRMGIKPYHFRLNDTLYNYGAVEPLSTIVGTVIDAMEIANHPDTDELTALEVITSTIGVIGYNLTNKSFMSGIQSVMDAARNPGRYSEKFFKNYARSMLPGSQAIAETKKMTDHLVRYRKTLQEMYMARLPGLSKNLPPKIDLWGRPIGIGSRFSSPYKPNEVDKELIRINLGLNRHPTVLTYTDKGLKKSVEIELEPKEIEWFHRAAGKLAFQKLNTLITNPTKFAREHRLDRKWVKDFKGLQKMSKDGNKDATETLATEYKRILTKTREEIKYQLIENSPYSERVKDYLDTEFAKIREDQENFNQQLRQQ